MPYETITETVWDCQTCDSPNHRNYRDHAFIDHMTKLHTLCKCGRWFVAINVHLGNHMSDAHHAVKTTTKPKMKPRVVTGHKWVDDPPPPEERVPWVGFRCWRVYPAQPILMPLNDSTEPTEWMPGREDYTATCRTHLHAAPAASCKCGFWGLNDLWEAIGRNPAYASGIAFHWQLIKNDLTGPLDAKPILVAGVLELYGRLIRGEDGARASKAKILALWPVANALVDPAIQARVTNTLAKLYKVDVASTWEYLALLAEERRVLYAAADAIEPTTSTPAG